MEIPVWIIAISQLITNLLVIVLLIALIAAVVGITKAIKSVSAKANELLDDVKDAADYVKESKVNSFFKIVFAPAKKNPVKKLFRRGKKDQ